MTITVRPSIQAVAQRNADKLSARRASATMRQMERYHFLRAHGLCVLCKRDSQGYVYCHECRLYKNQYRSWDSTAPRSPRKDLRRARV